jgi:hypothetical protein
MSSNGQKPGTWGYALEREQPPMLQAALRSLQREGIVPVSLPGCNGEACPWTRQLAQCLQRGDCHGLVLFCNDAVLCCCVANKVAGVRAAAVWTVPQAQRAVRQLGANLLAVEPATRTFYELKEMLRLCATHPAACPPGVACVLQELDGHAHR